MMMSRFGVCNNNNVGLGVCNNNDVKVWGYVIMMVSRFGGM